MSELMFSKSIRRFVLSFAALAVATLSWGVAPVSAQACLTCPSYFISSSARSGVNLRAAPTTRGQVVGGIPPGAIVRYLGDRKQDSAGRSWMNVVYQEKRGWVVERVLEPTSGTANRSAGGLSTTPTVSAPAAAVPAATPVTALPTLNLPAATTSTSESILNDFAPVAPLALLPLDQLAPVVLPDNSAIAPAPVVSIPAPAAVPVVGLAPTPAAPIALAKPQEDAAAAQAEITQAPTTSLLTEPFVARPLPGAVRRVATTKRTTTSTTTGTGGSSDGFLVTSSSIATYTEPGRAFATGARLPRNGVATPTGEEATDADGRDWIRIRNDSGAVWVEKSLFNSGSARVVAGQAADGQTTSRTTNKAITYRLEGVVNGLRMRSAPGTQFKTIATVPSKATKITPLGEQFQGWAYVRYGRYSGWVSTQFLVVN